MLEKCVKFMDRLPAIPNTLTSILSIAEDPKASVKDVVSILEYDMDVTANCIKLCNSAYFGRKVKVSNLSDASVAIGIQNIIKILMAGYTSKILDTHRKGYGFRPNELWYHSVLTAIISKCIIKYINAETEHTLFVICLLHDIGKIAMDAELEKHVGEILRLKAKGYTIIDIEHKVLGFTHSVCGAEILKKWKFPQSIIDAVENHHNKSPTDTIHKLVQLSDLMANIIFDRYPNINTLIKSSVLTNIGLTNHDVSSILKLVPEEVDKAIDLLNLRGNSNEK